MCGGRNRSSCSFLLLTGKRGKEKVQEKDADCDKAGWLVPSHLQSPKLCFLKIMFHPLRKKRRWALEPIGDKKKRASVSAVDPKRISHNETILHFFLSFRAVMNSGVYCMRPIHFLKVTFWKKKRKKKGGEGERLRAVFTTGAKMGIRTED